MKFLKLKKGRRGWEEKYCSSDCVQFLVEKSVKGARVEKMISSVAWLQVTASGMNSNKKPGWLLVHLQWEKKEGFQTFPHPAGSLLAPLLQSCQSFSIILVDFWLSEHAVFICSSLTLPAKQAGLSKCFFNGSHLHSAVENCGTSGTGRFYCRPDITWWLVQSPSPPNCLLKSRGNWKKTFRSAGTGM